MCAVSVCVCARLLFTAHPQSALPADQISNICLSMCLAQTLLEPQAPLCGRNQQARNSGLLIELKVAPHVDPRHPQRDCCSDTPTFMLPFIRVHSMLSVPIRLFLDLKWKYRMLIDYRVNGCFYACAIFQGALTVVGDESVVHERVRRTESVSAPAGARPPPSILSL